MKSKKIKNTYFIRLERKEKIIETLKNFCIKNKIKCGYFFGIGALDEIELSQYTVENKKWKYNNDEQRNLFALPYNFK